MPVPKFEYIDVHLIPCFILFLLYALLERERCGIQLAETLFDIDSVHLLSSITCDGCIATAMMHLVVDSDRSEMEVE